MNGESIGIRAVALWSPEYPSLDAYLAGKREGEPAAPTAALLPRRMRGRASMLTRMLAEVVERVLNGAGCDPSTTPVLVGSAYGEFSTTAQLLEMQNTGDGSLSPARFQASVHNTAAGQLSMATTNRGFGTCLAAGVATPAVTLVEALAFLRCHGGSVVAAVGDETLPAFFPAEESFGPLAAALCLSVEREPAPIAELAFVGLDSDAHAGAQADPGEVGELHNRDEPFAKNSTAALLALLCAVGRDGGPRERRLLRLPALSGAYRFEVGPIGATTPP